MKNKMPSIEDRSLPRTLEHLISSLLEDGNVHSWQIFSDEKLEGCTLKIKFSGLNGSIKGSHGYKRKSVSQVNHDHQRAMNWKKKINRRAPTDSSPAMTRSKSATNSMEHSTPEKPRGDISLPSCENTMLESSFAIPEDSDIVNTHMNVCKLENSQTEDILLESAHNKSEDGVTCAQPDITFTSTDLGVEVIRSSLEITEHARSRDDHMDKKKCEDKNEIVNDGAYSISESLSEGLEQFNDRMQTQYALVLEKLDSMRIKMSAIEMDNG